MVCLGATYKPNMQDTRESPALEVVKILREKELAVTLFDPLIPEHSGDSVLAVARGSDLLALLVPHDRIVDELCYRKSEILAAMRRPLFLTFTPGLI